MWQWFLSDFDHRSSRSCRLDSSLQRGILLPAPLGQFHYHGCQLRGVGADGSISNSWSNGADTQHQLATVVMGAAALVNQRWPRLRALDNIRQCSSAYMLLNGGIKGHTEEPGSCGMWVYDFNRCKRWLYLPFVWFRIRITFWRHPSYWFFKSFIQVLCKDRMINNVSRDQLGKWFWSIFNGLSRPGLRVLSASLSMVMVSRGPSAADKSDGEINANGSLFSGDAMT